MGNKAACTFVVALILALARLGYSRKGYKGEALSYNLSFDSLLNATEHESKYRVRYRLAMPERFSANLTVERFGHMPLTLVRQRYMSVPSRAVTSSNGITVKTVKYRNKDVFFYTDTNGRGSVACDLKRNVKTGTLDCEMSAIVYVGQSSCYISPGAKKADCTPRVYDRRSCKSNLTAPDGSKPREDVNTSTRQQNGVPGDHVTAGNGDYRLPKPGYRTVEVVFVMDAKYMEVFYDRHPGSPKRAQREVTVYMSLLANEINVFFDSFNETTDGKFVMFVYPVAILFPKYGEDFRWSASNNDGKVLTASKNMNFVLWKFVEKVLSVWPADHVMTFTGYRLHREDGHVLGFAYSGTVCADVTWKYSMVEFMETDVSATAAHELGHALGAKHDEDAGCEPSSNIMTGLTYSPTADTRDHYFRFSRCSLRDIRTHLKMYPDCTSQNSFTDSQFAAAFCGGFLGGQDHSLDLQCQRRTGYAGSTACKAVVDDAGCYSYGSVRCRGREGRCIHRLGYVWNGTPCGSGKMCFKGRCTSRFDMCPSSDKSAPCQCCSLAGTGKKRCCSSGKKTHGQDCYCCGNMINVQPPPGIL